MFSGIVQAIGTVAQLQRMRGDVRLIVEARDFDLAGIAPGASIAVSGVCLTAVGIETARIAFDVSPETLARTTLGALADGAPVNLERALRLGGGIDGHLVAGHVDGVGRVAEVEADARSQRWTFEAPADLARYIAVKGSICIDGVSLTVNETQGARFGINLIPHTIAMTTFKNKAAGDLMNLEVDLIARYVERLLRA